VYILDLPGILKAARLRIATRPCCHGIPNFSHMFLTHQRTVRRESRLLLSRTRIARQGASHTRDRDVQLSRNLAQRQVFASQVDDRLGIDQHARSTDPLSQAPGMIDARPHTLDNQSVLELGHCTDDVKQQSTTRRGGVDVLRNAHKIDVQAV